jgi:hypothetical protein
MKDAYLATSKMMVTSLDLSAADLSLLPLDTANLPDLPLTDGVVAGQTTQSGTPTPSAPVPLVNSIKAGTYRYTRNGREYVVTLPEMRSVGGVADTWNADTGAMEQPDGTIVLDGTQTVCAFSNPPFVQDQTLACFIIISGMADLGTSVNLLCSHFAPVGAIWDITKQQEGCCNLHFYFTFKILKSRVGWVSTDTQAQALAKVTAWLSANPVTLVYQLATPVTSANMPTLASSLHANVDSFEVGDNIRVISKPHSVDDWFLLTEKDEDLLDPAKGSVSLGKDKTSLAGSDVAGDRKSASALEQTARAIKSDYQHWHCLRDPADHQDAAIADPADVRVHHVRGGHAVRHAGRRHESHIDKDHAAVRQRQSAVYAVAGHR